MNKNLGWKLGLVFATRLFFLFGIFGIPKGFSGRSLAESLQDRINLGLDLKGGTHLILQVQVNDAVKVDADNALERLKEDMHLQDEVGTALEVKPQDRKSTRLNSSH